MSTKEQKIKQAIRLIRIDEDIDMQCEQAQILLRNTYPALSDDFIKDVVDKGRKELNDKFIAYYSDHFVELEIDQLIKFWTNGIGIKLASASFRKGLYKMGDEWANDLHRACALESNEDKNEV